MKKSIPLIGVMTLLAISLPLIGCSSSTSSEVSSSENASSADTKVESKVDSTNTSESKTPSDFTVSIEEVESITDDNGKDAVKVSFEFINRGETISPSEVLSIKMEQGGNELQASTVDGKSGAVEYQVRGGGSVKCFVVCQLIDKSDVSLDFYNVTSASTEAILSQTVAVS